MRTSNDEIKNGMVLNGFDYTLQVWIKNGIVIECGHPVSMGPDCCMARKLAGQDVNNIYKTGVQS